MRGAQLWTWSQGVRTASSLLQHCWCQRIDVVSLRYAAVCIVWAAEKEAGNIPEDDETRRVLESDAW